MPNGLAAHTILLSSEGERDERGGDEIRVRTAEQIKATMADPNAYVLNTEKIVH